MQAVHLSEQERSLISKALTERIERYKLLLGRFEDDDIGRIKVTSESIREQEAIRGRIAKLRATNNKTTRENKDNG